LSKLFQANVKENAKLSKSHYLITLHPVKKIKKPEPGQFFMLAVNQNADPLLRRPFSLHRWLGRDLQLLFRSVGKATNILKEKKPGEMLEIIGPLGNSFPLNPSKSKPVLVAGGLGIAPLFALAEKLSQKKPLFFLGAKNREEVLCIEGLNSIGIKPVVSTDDGSLGQKGLITDVLKDFLSRHPSPLTRYCLYACGPKSMLKELFVLTKDLGVKGYFALEENMACGIGACLSCAVNTKKGVKRVCKEGPVFPIDEIIW